MAEWAKIGGTLIALSMVSLALFSVQLKREKKIETRLATDPQFETKRADKIASKVGLVVIWLITALSGLAVLTFGIMLLQSLLSESIVPLAVVSLVALTSLSLATVGWGNRLLKNLNS